MSIEGDFDCKTNCPLPLNKYGERPCVTSKYVWGDVESYCEHGTNELIIILREDENVLDVFLTVHNRVTYIYAETKNELMHPLGTIFDGSYNVET
jgi:hypothetical protein